MSDKKEVSRTKLAIYAVGGFIAGVVVSSAWLFNVGYTDEARKLKDKCEENMPRSQQCVMRYVEGEA